jgi:large subunit ribosomal protein L33
MTISSVLDEVPAVDSFEGDAFEAELLREGFTNAERASTPRFEKRQRIVLSCAGCGARNYRKTKARREGVAALQLKKFCHTCNAHTQHREAI